MNLEKVREALEWGSRHGGRQALFAEGRDPAVWQKIAADPAFADMRRQLEERAQRYRQEPIGTIPFSLYRLFDTTGNRMCYEDVYFERRGRLDTFAVCVLLYHRPADVAALEDIIWALCDEYTWCLPAHLGGKSLQVPEETQVPDETGRIHTADRAHACTVDLFASETAYALSEITALLEPELAPLVVSRARREVVRRVLGPYAALDAAFGWETTTNNWAAVCGGSVGAAAVYLVDSDDTLAPLIHRLLSTMESFLSGYGDDGACTEGLGYWEYGFGFYTCFAELLRQRTAGRIDLLAGEKLARIARFPQACRLSRDRVVSFSDGDPVSHYHPGLLHRLAQRIPDVRIPEESYACGLYDDSCYRWCHFVRDFVWRDARPGGAPQPGVSWLPDAQWFIARRQAGGGLAAFAAKGGHNGESHNHNDLGSFLFHVGGDTLLTDLGSGEYTKEYFGPRRYEIFCNGSQGHSVPVIEGHFQAAGAEHAARVCEVLPERGILRLELAGGYDDPNLRSFVRGFDFAQEGPACLTVTDTFAFAGQPGPVVERFVSLCEPRLASPGRLVLRGERGAATVAFDPGAMKLHLGSQVDSDHQGKPRTVHVMDFELTGGGDSLRAVFTVTAG